jgi:hypothetical protein
LIVPEIYAGDGRRAARIAGQKNAAGRAFGLELAIWDRRRLLVAALDEPADRIQAWVAGPAALLVAKAHKVHERLAQVAQRPDRLRPKDSGDVALLMMVTDGAGVARVMTKHVEDHPEIADVVDSASEFLVEMYGVSDALPRAQGAAALGERFAKDEVLGAIDQWLADFARAT